MALPKYVEMTRVVEVLSEDLLRGKVQAIRLAMVTLLCGGHLLVEDIPGLGKTTLALALARVLGLSFGRIQCTSDLLPSDITGLSIYERDRGRFRFVEGPVFNHLVLVDEVNRAMPKTQSALLEAMEERRVTIEGTTHKLPEPFLVIATQNPVEQVGTYPLPESQLDRFLVTTGIGYPPAEIEKKILQGGSVRERLSSLRPVVQQADILEARQVVSQKVILSERMVEYIFQVISATRNHPHVLSGISTRGGIHLAAAARAQAFLCGRDYVVPEDVQHVLIPVGAHRLVLDPEHESESKEALLRSIVHGIEVPLD